MYDIKSIKSIPIADVAKKYGIDLEKKHGRLWGKLRNEKTSSFSINLSKNLWYDFGAGKGGSVIDLVMEIEGVDRTEAINKLAEEYNFKNEVVKGWHPLTDSQYREIGIEPERATLNFNFDLRVHTPEQLLRWNEKYGIPVKELAEKNPDTYNKLIKKLGSEHISNFRDAYFTKVKLAIDPSVPQQQREAYKHWAELDAAEINSKVDLLQRSLKGNINITQELKVNPIKDFKSFESQKNMNTQYKNEDEKIRDKIVKVYKKLYNLPQADYLTVSHAKALQELNVALNSTNNKYLPIHEIKELYKYLGNHIQNLEDAYSETIKEKGKLQADNSPEYKNLNQKSNNIISDLISTKDMFKKCSYVIEGFREATKDYNNELAKQNKTSTEKVLKKEFDISI